MYKIESQLYGYKLSFSGKITVSEMNKFYADSMRIMRNRRIGQTFFVIIDMRGFTSIEGIATQIREKALRLYIQMGMKKVVFLGSSPNVKKWVDIAIKDLSAKCDCHYIGSDESDDPLRDARVIMMKDGGPSLIFSQPCSNRMG